MPELPEVENYRKFIEGTSMHKKIARIWIDDEKLSKPSASILRKALTGNEFVATDRIGKYLFVELKKGGFIVIHFGLTGDLGYYSDDEDRPRFTRITFQFTDGFFLAYICMRKFGWVRYERDIDKYLASIRLGKDATKLTLQEFQKKLQGRNAPIKTLLLDQNIAAGVGNWIADEILYQSRIHPETAAARLSENDVKKAFQKMKYILKVALKTEADNTKFPRSFLIHNRELGGICYYSKKPLKKIVVGGRGTYFSPAIQKKK